MNNRIHPSSTTPESNYKLRSDALRNGELLDITGAARQAGFLVPIAMTPSLWRKIAGSDPFRVEDERILELLAFVRFAMVGMVRVHRHELTQKHDLVVFETAFGTGLILVRLTCHGGDDAEPVLSLALPDESIGLE
jgi:hypothetical protein